MPKWRSGKTTGLRIGQYKVVEGRGFESRRQLFFFFFFLFNIHTSDKLEIFFDHSILVNAALMTLTHGVYTVFLAALTMKTVYTPWVNAKSAAFTGTE